MNIKRLVVGAANTLETVLKMGQIILLDGEVEDAAFQRFCLSSFYIFEEN